MDSTPGPVPSPQPPKNNGKHDTQEIPIIDLKRSFRRRLWRYIGFAFLGAGGIGTGGISMARGESQETKNARMEMRLDAGEKAVAALADRVDAGEKARVKLEKKVDRVELLLELELDQHGIPQAKRPPKIEADE